MKGLAIRRSLPPKTKLQNLATIFQQPPDSCSFKLRLTLVEAVFPVTLRSTDHASPKHLYFCHDFANSVSGRAAFAATNAAVEELHLSQVPRCERDIVFHNRPYLTNWTLKSNWTHVSNH